MSCSGLIYSLYRYIIIYLYFYTKGCHSSQNLRGNSDENLKKDIIKMKDVLVHSTAIVDTNAKIGNNVTIGPYTIVGPEVTIGESTVVENHVTLKGNTKIGENNYIGPYTSIGLSAQDKAHRDELTKVVIGDFNEIREYVSINRGTSGGTGITLIGNHNQIMINSHLGHDVSIGDHCMIANSTTFAGHVQIGSFIVTGGMSGIHQFCRIGDYSMLGAYSALYQDIPPYMNCAGHRAQIFGLNTIGLKRNGFTKEQINNIQRIFDIFFGKGLVPQKAVEVIRKEVQDEEIVEKFTLFVTQTSRGIVAKA